MAYFDCFSGISGDMALGALIDAGGELAVVEAAVESLGLAGEVAVEAWHEQRGHLGGTRVQVECRPGPSRTLPALEAMLGSGGLPQRVRDLSLAALRRLGAAEAAIHGTSPAELHLHELGGADTLIDLAGFYWLLDSLGVEAVHASPLPVPRGWLSRELPLPAPASLRVLEGTGAMLEPDDREVELVTPTGAALLAAVARFTRPAMALDRVGYGVGGRDMPGNALGVWLGGPLIEAGTVAILETNLDDMPPNLLAALVDDLMMAGALDVTVQPVLMKKGRPGHTLKVIAETSRASDLGRLVLERSPTLGLRMTRAERLLAARQLVTVKTAYGEIRVKVKLLDGVPAGVAAEFEDCRRAALKHGADVALVKRLAESEARLRLEMP